MSRNPDNHTATVTADRHLHAVADDPAQQETSAQAVTAEEKVRTALAAQPESTAAELALAAGVGRSTAAKALARWGRDGTAIRTQNEGPSTPDTWTLAAPSTTDSPGADGTPTEATLPSPEPTADSTEHAGADDAGRDEGGTVTWAVTEGSVNGDAEAHTADDGDEDDGSVVSDAAIDNAPHDVDVEASQEVAGPESAITGEVAHEPEPASAAADGVRAPVEPLPDARKRLPKGALRGLVEEYLVDRPGQSFGPAQIGKALGRSGGAVNNALEKLVEDGYVTKTCEAPKRFAVDSDVSDDAQ